MKKSTEFILQLLLTIIEPLINMLAKYLDGKENDGEKETEDEK